MKQMLILVPILITSCARVIGVHADNKQVLVTLPDGYWTQMHLMQGNKEWIVTSAGEKVFYIDGKSAQPSIDDKMWFEKTIIIKSPNQIEMPTKLVSDVAVTITTENVVDVGKEIRTFGVKCGTGQSKVLIKSYNIPQTHSK